MTGPIPTSDAERKARAEAEKAEADARLAEANAEKARHEVSQYETDVAAQQRQAEARKAIAEAEKATADARQSEVVSLIPDLAKIEKGETTTSGTEPILGAALARLALEGAVDTLVGAVRDVLPDGDGEIVLITDDPDLATSDATYGAVTSGFTQLTSAAAELIGLVASAEDDFGFAPAVVGAVAAAIPPLLSMFSARRSVSSAVLAPDNTAALAHVAGQLTAAGKRVRIDDFRLVPDGHVASLESALRERRTALVRKKLEKDAARIEQEAQRVTSQEEVDDLTKALHALSPTDAKYNDIKSHLTDQRAIRDAAAVATMKATIATSVIGELLTSIDAFLVAVHAVPSGGARAPIVTAALREELRGSSTPRFTRVLFVNASSGSALQMTDDKPLWFEDKFESVAIMSVSYWIIDAATSDILVGGSAQGSARLKGAFGKEVRIEHVQAF